MKCRFAILLLLLLCSSMAKAQTPPLWGEDNLPKPGDRYGSWLTYYLPTGISDTGANLAWIFQGSFNGPVNQPPESTYYFERPVAWGVNCRDNSADMVCAYDFNSFMNVRSHTDIPIFRRGDLFYSRRNEALYIVEDSNVYDEGVFSNGQSMDTFYDVQVYAPPVLAFPADLHFRENITDSISFGNGRYQLMIYKYDGYGKFVFDDTTIDNVIHRRQDH